jgi:sensor c-di-GMP phosphodiesterase-like protein
MHLSRKEKLLSIASALLTAALAIGFFTLLSYYIDQKKQHRQLYSLSEKAFERTHAVLAEFEYGFHALTSISPNTCNQQSLDQLRATVKNSTYLKGAAIELSKNLYCTDAGLLYRNTPKPDYQTQNGALVWLAKPNLYSQTRANTVFIQRNNIVLSTLHTLFLDIVTGDDVSIVMFSSKSRQIMARYPESAQLSPNILKVMSGRDKNFQDKNYLYSAKHDNSLTFTVVTFQSKQSLHAYWQSIFWLWFPIGLLSGVLAGYAFYKRMQLQYTPIQRLINAIKNREFLVYYQPIIALHNEQCIGAETLIRWQPTDGPLVHPGLFIPLAEETGLIEPLTDLIFEFVLRDMAEQLRTGDFYISINLSAGDMAKPRFFEFINARLQALGIAPGKIAIEATERGFVDAEQANDIIRRFRHAGHAIFIDDFGTGYSSLSYLQHLAIDVIKIDKSFVDAIQTDSVTSSVITHIIAMAKQLHLKTVAEGVETKSQVDFLKQHGVDAVQGYYFAKPMPAQQFLRYLDQNRGLTE